MLFRSFVLFLIVKAYNAAKARMAKDPDAVVAEDVALLREIRDLLQA